MSEDDDLDAIGEEEEEDEDEGEEISDVECLEGGGGRVVENDDLAGSSRIESTTTTAAPRALPAADVVEPVDEEMRRRMEGERLVKSGYLMKKGERRKTWKKRWFVLRTEKLAYYKDDKVSPGVVCMLASVSADGRALLFAGIRPLSDPQPARHSFCTRRSTQEESTPHDRPRYFVAHILCPR